MKIELSKQLLKDIIEPIVEDEAQAVKIFSDLHFLGEYKYDHYEMYAPGRHFLEHFYLWIKQFEAEDRKVALDLVLNNLIFISRREFELLSGILYHEIVRRIQFDRVAEKEKIQRYKVNKIAKLEAFKKIERSTLYIGMSDGARIDYFRRQNKTISNEQILTSYHVDQHKCNDMIAKLEKELGTGSRFKLLFLIDDFSASGTTLVRMKGSNLEGTLKQLESKTFPQEIVKNGKKIIEKPSMLNTLLSDGCQVYLCPMVTTQKAVSQVEQNISNFKTQLKNLKVKPIVMLDESLAITTKNSPIGNLCTKYYQKRMGDEHTKDVTFGYKKCGLTLTLHHNTPNNSLYILWNRLASEPDGTHQIFYPLFKRIERHRSIIR
ncbi:MAG: hypothetical protein KAI40_08695 [Desulfobacterales bacterium]|nr:hypothetical protein [Desulfobacterales bacterium]